MNITLRDGTVITEKREVVNGYKCFGYYLGDAYVFGAEGRFPEEDLQRLYDNGYFDMFKPKKMSKPNVRASMKYTKTNIKQVKLGLNKKTDADILAHLETVENVQGYIKSLIRSDMS